MSGALRRSSSDRDYSRSQPAVDDFVLSSHVLANMAAKRGQLLLLQRQLLKKEALALGWSVEYRQDGSRKDTMFDDENAAVEGLRALETTNTKYIPHDPLSKALMTKHAFRHTYEELCKASQWYFSVAGWKGAAEQISADLAIIRLLEGDYAAAAALLNPLVISQERWRSVGTWLLHLYAHCLKALNRRDEYVRVLLAILSRSVHAASKTRGNPHVRNVSDTKHHPEAEYNIPGDRSLDHYLEVVAVSKQLSYGISTPLDSYFSDIEVEPIMHSHLEHDGCRVLLRIRQLIAENITIDRASVRLTSVQGGSSDEIHLQSSETINLDRSIAEIWLSTNVC